MVPLPVLANVKMFFSFGFYHLYSKASVSLGVWECLAAPEHVLEHLPAPEQKVAFFACSGALFEHFLLPRSTFLVTFGAPEHFAPEQGKFCFQH